MTPNVNITNSMTGRQGGSPMRPNETASEQAGIVLNLTMPSPTWDINIPSNLNILVDDELNTPDDDLRDFDFNVETILNSDLNNIDNENLCSPDVINTPFNYSNENIITSSDEHGSTIKSSIESKNPKIRSTMEDELEGNHHMQDLFSFDYFQLSNDELMQCGTHEPFNGFNNHSLINESSKASTSSKTSQVYIDNLPSSIQNYQPIEEHRQNIEIKQYQSAEKTIQYSLPTHQSAPEYNPIISAPNNEAQTSSAIKVSVQDFVEQSKKMGEIMIGNKKVLIPIVNMSAQVVQHDNQVDALNIEETPSICSTSNECTGEIQQIPNIEPQKIPVRNKTRPSKVNRTRRASKPPQRYIDHDTIIKSKEMDDQDMEIVADVDLSENMEFDTNEPSTSTDNVDKRSREKLNHLTVEQKYHRIRHQNNEASKKCRQKKKSDMKEMSKLIEPMQEENNRLQERFNVLLSVRNSLEELLKEAFAKNRK